MTYELLSGKTPQNGLSFAVFVEGGGEHSQMFYFWWKSRSKTCAMSMHEGRNPVSLCTTNENDSVVCFVCLFDVVLAMLSNVSALNILTRITHQHFNASYTCYNVWQTPSCKYLCLLNTMVRLSISFHQIAYTSITGSFSFDSLNPLNLRSSLYK